MNNSEKELCPLRAAVAMNSYEFVENLPDANIQI